jgi:SAM-dependent methyltransferase
MTQAHVPGGHDHDADDLKKMITKEFWDERYGATDALWSGKPNQRLLEHATDLRPGNALDVGSGEGADAIWLAARGWQVTAVDISSVALSRAAQHAAEAGRAIADRITWQQADLLSWSPPSSKFDLVSSHFMQLPRLLLEKVHSHLAEAVRPGGTLLIVGHDASDVETTIGRPKNPSLYYTAAEVAGALDPRRWEVVFAAAPERQVRDPEGRPVTIRDAIVKAVRRRSSSSATS